MAVFTYLLLALCAGLAAWAGYRAARDRPVILRQLVAGAVVELVILVELVLVALALARGTEVDEPATLWGYLAVMLVVLPVAAAWSFAERTRWSSVVLLGASITLGVMQLRVLEVWLA